MFSFLRDNSRWVAGGFLLTFFSSFGQTFFISLSAGDIRREFALSHGGFGTLYMLATLASALTLPRLGRIVDHVPVSRVTLISTPMLALACVAMAFSNSLVMLFGTIYVLRLFGQGMMTHIAMTAMGKWYAAQRGRAVSVSAIGVNFGEALLPSAFVLLAGIAGWRNSWLMAAGMLLAVGLPAIYMLMLKERTPQSAHAAGARAPAPDWAPRQVLRDPLFYLVLMGVLAPPFIGTTIFFHQIYLIELRGWTREAFAASFAVMSVMTVIFSLVSGQLIDRFTAVRLLPVLLLPMAIACFVLAGISAQWSAFAFMALLGLSAGFSSTLFGAIWAEIYGTAQLGAIRSIIVSAMVFMSALGPGVSGFLIDLDVSYPGQIAAMGVYCLGASAMLYVASQKLIARRGAAVPSG
jgi:MFS family permease